MQGAARHTSKYSSRSARRWVRWLLVALLPWLLSGLGQSVLHSANCPDVIVLSRVVAHPHSGAVTAHSSTVQQHLVAADVGTDEVCLTSLWAMQSVGMQVATVPLTLVARVTAPLLPPVFLVSGVALPRGSVIRGPPATEFFFPVV